VGVLTREGSSLNVLFSSRCGLGEGGTREGQKSTGGEWWCNGYRRKSYNNQRGVGYPKKKKAKKSDLRFWKSNRQTKKISFSGGGCR